MKRWKLFLMLVVVSIGLGLSCMSCVVHIDPLTGEKQYSIDPNIAGQIEVGVETGITLFTILSAFWPALIPVATLAAGAYGAWRKIKPKLTAAQSEALLYHTLGDVTVEGINEWKKLDPENWAKLKAHLEAMKDRLLNAEDRKKIDNLIRGFCGKPPRE